MIILLVYLLGYMICGCLTYFMQVIDKDNYNTKVYLYKLAKISIFSWLGVIVLIALLIASFVVYLDEQIEEYLMK